jgi:GNAT superfamily N-acetyltransferase
METVVVQVRPARREDSHTLAEIHAEAWRGAYSGIIPHLSLERMIAHRGASWWDMAVGARQPPLVLEFDEKPIGYATFGRNRSGGAQFQGEIFEIYLHPIYQGLGFGGRLFADARRQLLERRLKGLVVWALADNDGACSFYLGLGGKPIAEGAECFGKVSLRKIAFAWS